MTHFALAVDIGATKVALALVDRHYIVSSQQEIPVSGNPRFWEDISEATRALMVEARTDLLGVGIGSAGPLHLNKGAISPVNIPAWRMFPIVSNFQKITGSKNVVLHGDAMALAHAEFRLGAGRGTTNMLGMVVSTGIGGGLILNSSLFTGETGNSCYIGHHTINFDGAECACGRRGCVETYSSGPRMVAIARERGWSDGTSFIELAEAGRQGNSTALEVIDEGTKALAIGIVNTIGSLDIRTVVIGGGVSQAGEIFWKPLRDHCQMEANTTGFIASVDLRIAQLQRNAGVIGAALGVLDSIPEDSSRNALI